MKRKIMLILMFAVLIVCLTACQNSSDEIRQAKQEGQLAVVTSFYPMYDFALKIGGEKVKVVNLVPAGTEPHDWEPAPTDIACLEQAEVFIYNGAGMEHWVDDVVGALDHEELIKVEASQGIALLESDHSHSDGSEEMSDPHVWLDPENVKVQMNNILEAFTKADPDHADYYKKQYETYAGKFDELDQEFTAALSEVSDRNVIVAHEAFGYLCNAYGLRQIGIEGLAPDSEPDPARMEEIVRFAKENQVRTIFFEELVSPKVAETIAREIGAETQVLNPLEGLSEEQLKAGEDYLSVMRENLKMLQAALK